MFVCNVNSGVIKLSLAWSDWAQQAIKFVEMQPTPQNPRNVEAKFPRNQMGGRNTPGQQEEVIQSNQTNNWPHMTDLRKSPKDGRSVLPGECLCLKENICFTRTSVCHIYSSTLPVLCLLPCLLDKRDPRCMLIIASHVRGICGGAPVLIEGAERPLSWAGEMTATRGALMTFSTEDEEPLRFCWANSLSKERWQKLCVGSSDDERYPVWWWQAAPHSRLSG